jgi:hypothetical protein
MTTPTSPLDQLLKKYGAESLSDVTIGALPHRTSSDPQSLASEPNDCTRYSLHIGAREMVISQAEYLTLKAAEARCHDAHA